MNTLTVEVSPLAQEVTFTDDDLVVTLVDGRKLSVPIVWFPKLANATLEQLENYWETAKVYIGQILTKI